MRRRPIVVALAFLCIASDLLANATGSSVPPPVDDALLAEQAAIFLDGSRPASERVKAIQVLLDRGLTRSARAKAAPAWKRLMGDPDTPLAVRVAVACLYCPATWTKGERRAARRRHWAALVHQALSSDDEAVRLALSGAGGLFTPVAIVRALRHDSPRVRRAARSALVQQLQYERGDFATDPETFRRILRAAERCSKP